MYRILGADQKEYGPVGADEIRQWIAARRVIAQTQAREEGSTEWKPISQFPEFQQAFNTPPATASPPQFTPPPAIPANTPPASGLAISSLILGILSFMGCSVLTGIPAVITGHIAQNRTRRDPALYGGGGLAIAGLTLGYLSLLCVPLWLGLLLPALSKAKERATTINCVANMKQISIGALMWADDNEGYFPVDLLSLSNQLSDPAILACPGDRQIIRARDWSDLTPENISYEFLTPGANARDTPDLEAFKCPIHGHIGYADGTVDQGHHR